MDYFLSILKVVIVVMMILNLVPLLIWMERKGAAYIQDRRGPNRCDIFGIRLGGLIHSLADALKLLTKSDVTNREAKAPLFQLAPQVALIVAIIPTAVLPFAEPFTIGNITFHLQIADLNAGLLYVFALTSLSVYGLLLAGWSSGGKFSMLGALRGASQMISYELALGLSVVAIFLVVGSFRLNDIVAFQGAMPWEWNVVKLPLAFFLFFVALFAETNRLPFDLPEGEAELAAGFHTEYSSMRFAVFFMAEYAHIVVGSIIVSLLFFGGWHIPFISTEVLRAHASTALEMIWSGGAVLLTLLGLHLLWRYFKRPVFWKDRRDREPIIFGLPFFLGGVILGVAYFSADAVQLPVWGENLLVFLIQLHVLLLKTLLFCAVFIWVRWTLPRFRYDQLMRLGWKVMLPLGVVNVLIAGIMVLME